MSKSKRRESDGGQKGLLGMSRSLKGEEEGAVEGSGGSGVQAVECAKVLG